MEICRKPLVEQCGPTDWFVGYDINDNGWLDDVGELSDGTKERDVKGWQLITATENSANAFKAARLGAGTTARLALEFDADGSGTLEDSERGAERRYPRRVAFLRKSDADPTTVNKLVLDGSKRPVPIGIKNDVSGEVVEYYPYGSGNISIDPDGTGPRIPVSFAAGNLPHIPPNPGTLWFKTATNPANPPTSGGNYGYSKPLFYQKALAEPVPGSQVGTTEQPLLVPVLQLHLPTKLSEPNYFSFPTDGTAVEASGKNWMQTPTDTTFNLIIAAGDTPTRNADPITGTPPEFNGGLPNFPIFLENWNGTVTAKIKGSFIQVKRSAYATAPYVDLLTTTAPNSRIFGYPQIYKTGNSNGRSPYYTTPARDWGFDVGLLPQLPDAFSQRITTPSAGDPNKFYRELSRNDEWVKTLLCAKAKLPGMPDYDVNAVDPADRPDGFCGQIAAN
jgi:hypothetical protein